MINLPDLKTADVKNKKILLRLDLDVPLSIDGDIEDDTRLKDSLETLEYLLSSEAIVIIVGHLGRPEGKDEKLSLKPIANWFLNQLQITSNDLSVTNIEDFEGFKFSDKLFLLENIRFYKEEEENNPDFAKKLAGLTDIYINDAFAVSHREHASIVGVVKLLPHYAGFRLKKEIETLSSLLENPKRPFVVIIGGAKIETKLPLVEKMHQFADYVLVGGKIAEETRVLLKVQHEKVAERKSVLLVADLNEDETDTMQNSVENFLQIINLAKTIIWNGPIGKTEGQEEDLEIGTAKLAKGIVESGAYAVVGGGDTIGYLKKINLLDKFSFVSTGGGAMLEFLSGEKLPGIEALIEDI
ncbi:MAG: phosphoglycerate kinase [Candidatus Portnoybacteria bacterium CG10_big_fil_rev_8_21_14_0_10_36_7]|uniref:Phosphoglycerate kinase n=1 Tax=Candidatus Portnoybacteria bacterium CG10_big_fil_rev_8_21_14_0_10_36_7 TaxID=1974812 RepID=A0A2M8KDV3_9BACT|nr:MAG: phosphoglycerate kinase [Candidatus Portnoybacteria bacterium CG10_big_fil_rev_8_21_14_0_10_36_7]